MAATPVRLWEAALLELDKLPTTKADPTQLLDSSHGQSGHLPSAYAFASLPKVNAAAWPKLIDLKVLLHLGKAAAGAADPFAPKALAAVCALGTFINKAIEEGGLQRSTTGERTPNTLSKHLGLQLKQSGFLAALPRLLAAAATALADTQQDPAWADVPQNLSALLAHAPGPAAAVPAAAVQLMALQDVTGWLLLLARESLYFCPQQLDRAAVAVPALRLCAATLQLCSRCIDLCPADTAAPPTALEQLLWGAWSTGQAVCAAWDLNDEDFAPPVLGSADALRAVSMMLLVLTVCPENFFQQTPDRRDSRAARTKKVKVRLSVRVTTSLAAWQFACAHESELPQLQQEALQALGCSGRAFMYAAGHVLSPVVHERPVLHICQAFVGIARHAVTQAAGSSQQLGQLRRPQLLALARTLSSASEEEPPSSSPMLPCTSLFWLVPAVLLQWAGKQPTGGPEYILIQRMMMQLLHVGVGGALKQLCYWVAVDAAVFEAAGGPQAAWEQQQAMARAMYACVSSTALWAPVIPASMQGLPPAEQAQINFERRALYAAGEKAVGFSMTWLPSGGSLEQLLLLASNAAARMLAAMQDPSNVASAADGDGASSSDAAGRSSSGTGRAMQQAGALSATSLDTGSASSSCSGAEGLDCALFSLAQALPDLLKLCEGWLWRLYNKDAGAVRYDPLAGLRARGVRMFSTEAEAAAAAAGGSGGDDSDSLSSAEHDSMAALCTALQETLPQLTCVVEAAVRRGAGREPYGALAATAGSFLESVISPGVFVAAELGQPGSPVLKPLCGLTYTLMKVVFAINAKPDAGYVQQSIANGLRCLECALRTISIVLQAACATTTTSSTGSGRGTPGASGGTDAVIRMFLSSSCGNKPGTFSEDELAAISSSTAQPPASSSSSDAVAMLPWLVSLGRACLGYSLVLRGSYAGRAGASAASQKAMQGHAAAMGRAFGEVSAVLPGWLQSSGVSAQLHAAGYLTAPVLELLQSASVAQQHVSQTGPGVLAQLLQGLGLALCSMPVGTCCNNPLCGVLGTGLSEQQLVVGSSRRCSGCRVARYCDRSCQLTAWKQHKPACKAIAAAAAAAAAAAPKPAAI